MYLVVDCEVHWVIGSLMPSWAKWLVQENVV